MFALAAPISIAGVVLSHPDNNTTPSIGLARIDSSTSILIKFLYNIEVGFIWYSPSDMTGNSNGNPPACQIPRFTDSANCLRFWLQWVSSLQELHMPIIGLFS